MLSTNPSNSNLPYSDFLLTFTGPWGLMCESEEQSQCPFPFLIAKKSEAVKKGIDVEGAVFQLIGSGGGGRGDSLTLCTCLSPHLEHWGSL